MLKKLTTFLILILFITVSVVQSGDGRKWKQHKISDGSEVYDNISNFQPRYTQANYQPLVGDNATYTFHPCPTIVTVYDLQSNGVPDEIWQDPLAPNNVHAVFMYSTVAGFATRQCAYFFSNDAGANWDYLGDVPNTARAGFPSVNGLSNGAAVIGNHNTTNGTTARTKIYYDQGPGFGAFTEIDGGAAMGDPIWPRVLGIGNNKVAFVASVNATTGPSYTNSITSLSPPNLSGYVSYSGDQAETYSLALAPNGRVGHAYIGEDATPGARGVFYRFSTDDGLTWNSPTQIWTWNTTDSLGCLRGVTMVYGNNNEPYVAFNLGLMDDAGGFAPDLPGQIRVWSPNVNSGVPKIIADSSMIPFHPNRGNTMDAFIPICRPSIGRGDQGDALFVAMVATTGFYSSVDTNSYYAGWLAWTGNNGNTWTRPERFTPTTPLRDWRFLCLSHTNQRTVQTPPTYLVQIFAQDDSLAGTHVNGAEIGTGRAVGIRGLVVVTGINNISSVVPGDYNLQQNYPNPFNPTTAIRFDIVKSINVSLKVYNSSGQEVATLINNEIVTPGTKEVTFDGSGLSSGIYFYTLFAGEFKESKKMMLIK